MEHTWNYTAESLTAQGVPEEVAQQLVNAHEESLSALTNQYRREKHQRQLTEELTGRGVPKDMAQLAAATVNEAQMTFNDTDGLTNTEALMDGLKQQYPSLFPAKDTQSVPALNPLMGTATMPDISHMTPEEINRSWDTIRPMLANL